MSKASRQKYAPKGADVRDATPEEFAKLTVADVVIGVPPTCFECSAPAWHHEGNVCREHARAHLSPQERLAALHEQVRLPAHVAPDPLLTALRDLTRVMAAETLRQVAHCSRCDRPARFASGFTGTLICQIHRDEQAAAGQASFTALPIPAVAERLYAFVMGDG